MQSGYLWNSGMFMFRTDLFSEQVRFHAPDVYEAFASGSVEESFQKTPRISIDYGVLEKTDRIAVLPLQIVWNDLGSFTAFDGEYDHHKDAHGNISFHEDLFIDSSDNLVYSDKKKVTAVIGLDNIVIVDQSDALLVCAKSAAQEVKQVVDLLKDRKDKRSDSSAITYFAWGTQQILSSSPSWLFQQINISRPSFLVYEKDDICYEQWTVVQGSISLSGKEPSCLYKTRETFSLNQKGSYTLEAVGEGTELLVLRLDSVAVKL